VPALKLTSNTHLPLLLLLLQACRAPMPGLVEAAVSVLPCGPGHTVVDGAGAWAP
jgi:hypothetical protein